MFTVTKMGGELSHIQYSQVNEKFSLDWYPSMLIVLACICFIMMYLSEILAFNLIQWRVTGFWPQRWSGLHVTTFFYQCVCTCVLGHKEGPATQLISSVKKRRRKERRRKWRRRRRWSHNNLNRFVDVIPIWLTVMQTFGLSLDVSSWCLCVETNHLTSYHNKPKLMHVLENVEWVET